MKYMLFLTANSAFFLDGVILHLRLYIFQAVDSNTVALLNEVLQIKWIYVFRP